MAPRLYVDQKSGFKAWLRRRSIAQWVVFGLVVATLIAAVIINNLHQPYDRPGEFVAMGVVIEMNQVYDRPGEWGQITARSEFNATSRYTWFVRQSEWGYYEIGKEVYIPKNAEEF